MLLMFGKNLKKIRSVHGLSQEEFASLFDLKRGTLGAYEEGRSNPKLETVIKIANHFSIGLENLLISELTVNKLLKFNERLATQADTLTPLEFEGIPCIMPRDKERFINNFSSGFDMNNLSLVKLPYIKNAGRMAFTVDDLTMTGGNVEFFPKDIAIGLCVDVSAIADTSLVVALTKNELLLRKFYKDGSAYKLIADHHGVEDLILESKELVSIWKIEYVFNYNLQAKQEVLENRLATIEQRLAMLAKKNSSN